MPELPNAVPLRSWGRRRPACPVCAGGRGRRRAPSEFFWVFTVLMCAGARCSRASPTSTRGRPTFKKPLTESHRHARRRKPLVPGPGMLALGAILPFIRNLLGHGNLMGVLARKLRSTAKFPALARKGTWQRNCSGRVRACAREIGPMNPRCCRSLLVVLCLGAFACGELLRSEHNRSTEGTGLTALSPVPPCLGLDESACTQVTGCQALYSQVCWGTVSSVGASTMGTCKRQFAGCEIIPAPDPCAGLDEQSCLAEPTCEPLRYACMMACPVNGPCGCGGNYSGCHLAQAPPKANSCTGLDEKTCTTTSGCNPVYGNSVCPTCPAGTACAPCPPPGFSSCELALVPPIVDPCGQYDEASCSAVSGCTPEYLTHACACPAGTACAPCPPPSFSRCVSAPPAPPVDPCAGLDEASCNAKPECESAHVSCMMACPAGGPCPCPTAFAGCQSKPQPPPPNKCYGLDEQSCIGAGCAPQYATCPTCPPGAACSPCQSIYAGCL